MMRRLLLRFPKGKQVHEPPFAFVSHMTGTRIRLKIPSKKKDSVFFSSLAEKIPAIEGVQSVEMNPVTGSVLLLHSSDPEHIIQTFATAGFFRFESSSSERAHLQGRISEAFNGINVALKDVSENELDLGGAAFLILLALGGYQIIKGNFTAIPWYAAGWYALNIFLKSNERNQPVP